MSSTNEHDSRSSEQLKSLFRDQQWLITCLAQENGSYQGYLATLAEAWKATDAQTRQQIYNGQLPTALADCIRYALIYTTIAGNLGHPSRLPSVYGDNANVPPVFESLRDFMPDEVATDPQKLSLETIATIKDPRKRTDSLIELVEGAAVDEREALIRLAIETILEIQDGWVEFPQYLWEHIQPHLIGDPSSQYIELVLASPNDVARAWFIMLMAKEIRGKLLGKALDSAFSMQDSLARTHTLRALLRRIRGKQQTKILQEIYRTVNKIDDPQWKSRILTELVGKLTGTQRMRVIQQAMATIPLVGGSARGWDASRIMPYLSRIQRTRLLKKVLSARGSASQIEAGITLWYYLPQMLRQQVLNMALEVRERPQRAEYLAEIAQKLRSKTAYQETIEHIVVAILQIRNEDQRRTTIFNIRRIVQDEAIEQAAQLPVKRLTPDVETLQGYRFAFAQRDPQYVAYALGNLSVFMSHELKARAMPLMVDLALEIDLHDYTAEAIEGIAPYLDEEHLGVVLEGALRIGNGWSRVWALSGLAPYLTGERREICLHDALDALGLLEEGYQSDSWFDVDMAVRLLPSLKGRTRERVLNKALAAATKTTDNSYYDARIRILPFLEGEAPSELAAAILQDVPKLPDEDAQSQTLSSLASYLPTHRIASAIEIARTIKDEYPREGALSALIPYLPNTQSALEYAHHLEGAFHKSGALVGLLPRLTGETRATTLQLVMEITETIQFSGYRMGRWLGFLPLVEDQAAIRRKVIESMLDFLWAEKDSRRNSILNLCASSWYISEKILPIEVIKAMGEHVMQICMEWKW